MARLNGNRRPQPVHTIEFRPPEGFRVVSKMPEPVRGWLCIAPISRLVAMRPPWNPPERTDPDDPRSALHDMAESIRAHGLQQVPVANDEFLCIGNRRAKAMETMGMAEGPVIYDPWATPETFADEAEACKPHTPLQKAKAWLVCERAVTPRFRERMKKAREAIGMPLLRRTVVERNLNVLSLLYYTGLAWDRCKLDDENKRKFFQNAVEIQGRFREAKVLRDWLDQQWSLVILAERILACQCLRACLPVSRIDNQPRRGPSRDEAPDDND